MSQWEFIVFRRSDSFADQRQSCCKKGIHFDREKNSRLLWSELHSLSPLKLAFSSNKISPLPDWLRAKRLQMGLGNAKQSVRRLLHPSLGYTAARWHARRTLRHKTDFRARQFHRLCHVHSGADGGLFEYQHRDLAAINSRLCCRCRLAM